MNNDFFRPRSLCALVLTWNPDQISHTSNIDLTSTIVKSLNPRTGEPKTRNRVHTLYGNTNGNFKPPEAAPLLFLILDAAPTSTGSENEKELKGKMKIKGYSASDYMGRARAEFAAQSPESFLSSGPKENFKSRYADPNHPASSGNPWSLITAEEFNPPMGKDLIAARIDGGRGGGLGGLGGLLGAGRTDSSRRQRLIGGRMDRQQQVNNPGGMNGLGGLGNFVDLIC